MPVDIQRYLVFLPPRIDRLRHERFRLRRDLFDRSRGSGQFSSAWIIDVPHLLAPFRDLCGAQVSIDP